MQFISKDNDLSKNNINSSKNLLRRKLMCQCAEQAQKSCIFRDATLHSNSSEMFLTTPLSSDRTC